MDFNTLTSKVGSINIDELNTIATKLRADILTMTTLAKSGHPGGSMSSIDILLAIYSIANINKDNLTDPKRDKIIISNGHISPAVYSSLAFKNILDTDKVISLFRKAGSQYEGHIERSLSGIEWSTGNLGQGLSAAAGISIADKINDINSDIYVLMGDGEQQKGQISEARRFITKYNLHNIITFIDYNKLQISGKIDDIMPSLDIAKSFEADGFTVLHINGHDFNDIFGAILKAKSTTKPVVIIANTVMGKGVSFMENRYKYHGSPLSIDDYKKALQELNIPDKLAYYEELRKAFIPNILKDADTQKHNITLQKGENIEYSKDTITDNRSAFGDALLNVIDININNPTPIIVFDCDLAGSVKTDKVNEKYPHIFFQSGITEHNTSVVAGAASINNVVPIFSTFGMFGVDEVYNQQRLNAINETNLKLVTTHVGTDVGEDGKTHQCIDYLGLMRNIPNFKVIVPADANQTDHAVRYALTEYGNIHIAMGRSKKPIITNDNNDILFNKNYEYQYGKIDVIREEKGAYPIFSYGSFIHNAIELHNILKSEKILSTTVLNVSSPLFIDDPLLLKYLTRGHAFVYEDHLTATGLFSTLANIIAKNGYRCKLIGFGVESFPPSGDALEILTLMELDPKSIAKKIKLLNIK